MSELVKKISKLSVTIAWWQNVCIARTETSCTISSRIQNDILCIGLDLSSVYEVSWWGGLPDPMRLSYSWVSTVLIHLSYLIK
jgi:hypothetical protein